LVATFIVITVVMVLQVVSASTASMPIPDLREVYGAADRPIMVLMSVLA